MRFVRLPGVNRQSFQCLLGLDQRLAVIARRALAEFGRARECEVAFGGAPGLKPIPPRPDAPTYHESVLLFRGIHIHCQTALLPSFCRLLCCTDVYLFDAISIPVVISFVCHALDFLKRESQIFGREDDPRLASYEINFTQSRKDN
jgi:hypothetical protein